MNDRGGKLLVALPNLQTMAEWAEATREVEMDDLVAEGWVYLDRARRTRTKDKN